LAHREVLARRWPVKVPSTESRRRKLNLVLAVLLVVVVMSVVYALLIEPHWVRVVHLTLADPSSMTLVHLADLHYKGDQPYLDKVFRLVKEAKADLVCLTGDLVEDARFLPAVLAAVRRSPAPVFAVPGNHEHWSGVDFSAIDEACRRTGGALLVNSSVEFGDEWVIVGIDDLHTGNEWVIVGIDDLHTGNAVIEKAFADVSLNGSGQTERQGGLQDQGPKKSASDTLNRRVIFLTHCPLGIELLGERKVALALAGHSHGGQVRLPLIGALRVPQNVGPYDRGHYDTPNGPLYVTSGIGTWFLPLRFLCRPEIAVIRI
jgi:predicted MPP superfamily phosphohydrolase